MSPRRSSTPRVLALDLDGTLLRDDKTVSEFTVATLRRAQANGVLVFYVTGRRERIAMPVLQHINLPAYAILNNGPVALELPSRARRVTRYINPAIIRQVIDCLRAILYPPVIVIDPEPGSPMDLLMDRSLLAVPLYQQYAQRHENFIAITDDIATSPLLDRAVGMFVCEPNDAIDSLRTHLTSVLGELIEHRALDNLEYIPDHRILEMVQPGLTKWNGVELLLAALGIEDADVYAFGDDHNDLDMLAGATLSFAPANAIRAAKQAADRVIPANNDDGVALTIRALFPDVFA